MPMHQQKFTIVEKKCGQLSRFITSILCEVHEHSDIMEFYNGNNYISFKQSVNL